MGHAAHRQNQRPRPLVGCVEPENDFDFCFELNKRTMRKYVEELRGWDEQVEREEFEQHFRPGEDQIVVVDGHPVGHLAVRENDDVTYIERLAIAPERQGSGLGTSILREITDRAHRVGRTVELTVLADNPARHLYWRLGFREVGTTDREDHGLKIRMRATPGTVEPGS